MANNTDPSSSANEPKSKKLRSEEEVNNNDKQMTDSNKTKDKTNGHLNEDEFKFSESPSLEQIRGMHSKFCKDRNWDQFHKPRNVLLALVAELGELSELFQWKGECEVGLQDWTSKERTALEEELSDCLIYLNRLADRCRVDLPKAVVQKLAKNEAKYPVDKVFGSSKKYTEYQ